MKPAPFSYAAPTSLDEAIALLGRAEDAKLLAGGQSLVPMMNLRLAAPSLLIDLNRIPALRFVKEEGGELRIGAMTRHHEVANHETIKRHLPLLAHAASLIGYPAIRNRGTIGGSLVHADPSAEMPLVTTTLDATFVAVGPDGERMIAAHDFFDSLFTTTLQADEVLTEIRIPLDGAPESWAFKELSRKTGDFFVVAVAAVATVSGSTVRRLRVGVGGTSDKALRAGFVETLIEGRKFSAAVGAIADGSIREAMAKESAGEIQSDRWQVATALVERALGEVLAGSGGKG
jgi:aerobic carbon-monoxide dehydrogenase medium subunit